MKKGQFGCVFKHRVTNFKPLFLSPLRLKLKNFSAHQKENFLRILKLTLLLFLVPFWRVSPQKSVICLKVFRGLKNKIQIKVGWVFKNSGNFKSSKHRDFVIVIEIASVVRGSKQIWKKINSNQRSNSIQFSSEADRPRSWIELNLIWGLNLFSFKMSLLPRTTEAIYFKHHE